MKVYDWAVPLRNVPNPHHPTKLGQAHYPGNKLASQRVVIDLVQK